MHDPVPQPSEPTVTQIAATIAALADDRGPVQDAARRRLLAWGQLAMPQLREGAETDHVRTRTRCRALLRSLEIRGCLGRFARLRLDRGPGAAPALLDGALLLAQMVRTFVPESRRLAGMLRRQATHLRRECANRSLPTCARLLAERLHDQLGLRGSGDEELDVGHVSLDRVLVNRIGAPVSLSLIYLLVARWAGLSAAGVALPDHFLVRLHGPRPVLVDPFHGGRTITKADCSRYLRASGHDRVRGHLRDLSDREVLIHYLHQLRRAASRRAVPEARASLGEALSLLETT
jgi:regulator of sirC expression with transglutaminase-like and TPR domain